MSVSRHNGMFIGVMVCVAVVYLLTLPRFLERLDPLTGDEPFYVMTAISIVRDHDLDETNNYLDRDYDEFYPAGIGQDWRGWPAFPTTLPPHAAHTHLGGLHTKHGLGLSFLIALPYAVAGRIGADLFMLLCGVLLAGQMYLLGREVGASERLAAVVAVGLALTMPIAPYSLLIFPEVPAALLLVYAVRRLSAPDNVAWQWTCCGLAIGFLPWLHQRFGATAAVLSLILLFRALRSEHRARTLWALVPTVVFGMALILYNLWMYHSPLQNIADHAGFSGPAGTLNGFTGLLLDAQWGLLIASPLYLLAFVGLPCWFEKARTSALVAVTSIFPYVIVIAAYRVWWGEWGPPARYLVPIAPFAAATLCAWLARANLRSRLFAAVVWAVGLVLTVVGNADPQRFYHQPTGVNNLVRRVDVALHTDLASHLIAFQPYALASLPERVTAGVVLVLLMLAASLLVYADRLLRRPTDHRRGS